MPILLRADAWISKFIKSLVAAVCPYSCQQRLCPHVWRHNVSKAEHKKFSAHLDQLRDYLARFLFLLVQQVLAIAHWQCGSSHVWQVALFISKAAVPLNHLA